ncbi:hypothetical protein [Virgibacillus pantothenticus]|uniref:hypothetical protein n=1 Tax=Virgibacillus pantothenticus TaxID=1473 RepID=UPI001BB0D5F1|nr:hypothetical protein [Virgibacillus pantothenticus]
MYEVFRTQIMGEVFTQINKVIKEKQQEQGWTVQREDQKTVPFTFGSVAFNIP